MQQGYAPQAAYAQSPMQKQKKPINKKILLFGGIGLAALVLIIALASILGGSKGKDKVSADPNIGVWNVVSAEMWGFETDISDVFEKGFSIELLDKGKCKLNVDGKKGNGKWTFKDGVLTIKGGGLDLSGEITNGVLVIED
ncbi:MAG TPA: lipocalin family protein, partial [Clostridia bacterium]|nr:lipocalin family protein [Clostridia bacterium]